MTENKPENPLPKTLPGAVCVQWVKCGKPSCKCARGELHGPYYYRFVWRKGKQRKLYVKHADAERIRQACEAYRNDAEKRRAERERERQQLRAMLAEFTELRAMVAELYGGPTK